MRKLYFLLLCLIAPFLVSGQKYGNEWINYSQKYYKIKVAKDGVYRIDSATLAKAGIPLATIDPHTFQVFYHGQEQYIYVKGETTDTYLKGNDFIEFYAEHNYGATHYDSVSSDSLLYTIAYTSNAGVIPAVVSVPNPYFSLYNDTAVYFLTWDASKANRRMDTNYATNFSSFGPAPYFRTMLDTLLNTWYEEGYRIIIDGEGASDPRYTPAEGWYDGREAGIGETRTYNLAVNNVYTSSPVSAIVKTFFAGETVNFNHTQVFSSWSPTTPLTDTSFFQFVTCPKKYVTPASTLTGSSGFYLQFSNITPTSVPSSITGISYVTVQYPHTPNMGGAKSMMLSINDTAAGTYLQLTNLGVASTDSVRMYDLTGHRRLPVIHSGGSYNVIVQNDIIPVGAYKQCYLTSESQINKVANLIPAGNNGTFTNYKPSGITGQPYIMVTSAVLMAGVHQYAIYRAAKYDTVVADVEQLYDQFCYGIEKDPLSIRNFCNYALNKWSNKPSYLFLIGKGIHERYWRNANAYFPLNLVPSIGWPSSDAMFTAGLKGGPLLMPAIPTGRLAAQTTTDVQNYLDKVQTYENVKPALWQKNVAHFCGGSTFSAQQSFAYFLNSYKAIITDTSFGARVFTFKKTTSLPLQITLADSVTQLINSGVSVMTFFGHASGNNFDINLDAPSDYNNIGKYPLIIADACFSGDMFQPPGEGVSSTSEQFVLDKKGSIGFIATDDLGEENNLFKYTDTLYTDFCQHLYRKPMGYCMQQTINAVQGNGADMLCDFTCLEMILHGDPAIAINGNDSLPDYSVADTSVSFTPSNVTTQIDSFTVNVVVSNLAKAKKQVVPVEIDRVYPNDLMKVYRVFLTNGVYYQDTIKIKMPVDKVNGMGMNFINVKIDPGMTVGPEMTRVNNNTSSQGVKLWITSGDIIPVYPYNYAIIPHDTATLKACTGDPFASAHSYVFQLDTTDGFNTPFLKTQTIRNAKGGVVFAPWKNWVNTPGTPSTHPLSIGPLSGPVTGATASPLMFKDSVVYYWRVRRDTNDTKDFGWLGSSFQYIKGRSGWGQSHFYQFRKDNYSFMSQNLHARDWQFAATAKQLQCTNYGAKATIQQLYNTTWILDLSVMDAAGCGAAPALYVAIIDSITMLPWIPMNHPKIDAANSPANYSNFYCSSNDSRFMFRFSQPSEMQSLFYVLRDSVPKGDYILVYSWQGASFNQWGASKDSLQAEFLRLGGATASNIMLSLNDSIPWIFFAQKGNQSSAISKLGKNDTNSNSITTVLHNHVGYGSILSPIIGPAQKWDSISWKQHPLVKNAHDSVRLNVIGIDPAGNSKTLISNVPPSVANMYITSISPKQYPSLQFMLYTKDMATLTPAQMKKWQVFYTPVPEVAVNPSIYSWFSKNNMQGGDTVRMKTVVQNIGDYTMDSMAVNSWVANAGNTLTYLPLQHTKKMKPGDTAMISIKSSTAKFSGSNSIWFDVNPEAQVYTRPEEYYFNNYAKQNFTSAPDNHAPLLDVTFNGVHILNNDIVSTHPGILMEVTSDNRNLPLDSADTGKIRIYIRNIDSVTLKRVYIKNNPLVQFTPAVLPNNRCKVLYTPTFTDGTYELSVQAADIMGTPSGSRDYTVDFQVISKSMITNVVNYPNPFSTSTRFVFTITGEQLPTYFKIQIMTITGRVVREITEDELGPLHIGRNITQYAWDGTDQFGDKLANGVYFYRVVATLNNQSIEHMNTGADSYFKMGMGKMYLMR